MLFEQLLILGLVISSFFMIVLPIYKFISPLVRQKQRNPLKDAKMRLELAKSEFEAAKLNKEAEQYYEQLYKEALEDSELEEFNSKNRKV